MLTANRPAACYESLGSTGEAGGRAAIRIAAMNDEIGEPLAHLVAQIRACVVCAQPAADPPLPHPPRPVLQISGAARLLIAGQAPGNLVNLTGTPFNDPSGERLRRWMGVDRAIFYDPARIAIAPMGFCFPGYDAQGGDLPPRRECRALWHDRLFALMPQIETILAIGRHAQVYHLGRLGRRPPAGARVADIVADWRQSMTSHPRVIPLPHPSWRNVGWLKRHPWFEDELLPVLREEVARLIAAERVPSMAQRR
jgi:uracil-DNA glycosylase